MVAPAVRLLLSSTGLFQAPILLAHIGQLICQLQLVPAACIICDILLHSVCSEGMHDCFHEWPCSSLLIVVFSQVARMYVTSHCLDAYHVILAGGTSCIDSICVKLLLGKEMLCTCAAPNAWRLHLSGTNLQDVATWVNVLLPRCCELQCRLCCRDVQSLLSSGSVVVMLSASHHCNSTETDEKATALGTEQRKAAG